MNSTLTAQSSLQAATAMSDELLIREYQRTGERQYFSILYKRYTHLVFGACIKYLRDKEESRDVSMNIFEKILRKPPTEDIRSFKSWLHRYVKNECFYYIRTRSSRGKSFQKFEEMEIREAPTADNEGATRLESESAATMKLGEAIRKLPKVQKECIRLFYLKEKSYKQIVELTGYTDAQVKSYLQNGKRRLKVLMTGEEEEDD